MIQDLTVPQQNRPGHFSERTCPSGAGAGVKGKERDEGKRLREEGDCGCNREGGGIPATGPVPCPDNVVTDGSVCDKPALS